MKKLFLKFHWLLILLPVLAWAGNFGSSIEGKDANVSFVHTSAIDSAHFVFAYPDTSNWYDSVFTYPVAWGSNKLLNGAGLDLDSVGVHIVKIRYYSGGSIAGHTAGVWLHETDSTYNAITDVNKANFQADVSNLDVAVSTRFTQAGGDSVLVLSEHLVHFWAACDSCYTRHFPEDGSANKDSFYAIDGKRAGADSLLGKGEFRHSNEVDVADSAYFYKYPWWE